VPELIEVELYRRAAAQLTGATVRWVEVVDPRFVRPVSGPQRLARALRGRTLAEPERIGKVLVLRTDGQCLGLRFGMTGVLGVDGHDSLDELVYGPSRRDPAWIRLRIHTTGGVLYVRDPRILGSVELDPDLTRLGPDALAVKPVCLTSSASPVSAI
jgi:formamidopyrimidine-DNA glycosylase